MKDAYLFCTVLLVIGLSFAPAWTPLAAADFEDGLVLYFPFESSDDAQTRHVPRQDISIDGHLDERWIRDVRGGKYKHAHQGKD